MKRALLLFYMFLQIGSVNAQTGKYIPFPSNMIVYTYTSRANSDGGWYSAERFEIYGDTVLNGISYSKCYYAQTNRWGQNNSFPTTNLSGLNKVIGGVRNDIPGKKVYYYSFKTNAEELLYDFDLKLGDTLFKNEGYRFYNSLLTDDQMPKIDTVWVSRIDSVLMPHDNKYHRRFNFMTKFREFVGDTVKLLNSDSVYFGANDHYAIKINPLVEGVGIDFNPISVWNGFEHAFDMRLFCRTIDEQVAYNETSILPFMSKANCKSIVSGIDKEESKTGFTIYPNPSSGRFNLSTSPDNFTSFDIVNLLGCKVMNRPIKRTETEIDLSAQAPGIYFIRVYDNKEQFTTRKIILD